MSGMASASVPPVLSIIVPTYRDGSRIYGNLVKLDHALSAIGEPYEIIVVSDGNNDNTHEEARRMDAPHVWVLHYARNMGKGFALRYGMVRSHGQIVTIIDGDGDIDPAQIAAYVRIMRETDADIVVASKRHPDSQVVYPLVRRVYSMTYQALLRVFFDLKVRDTQVGLKLFKREALAAILPRIVVKRYAFDLELLVVAHHLGYTRVVEAPVVIGQRFSSTINGRAIMSILWETAAIFYRKAILHYYDRSHAPVPLHNLSAAMDSELSVAADLDERQIARNVVRWVGKAGVRLIRRCYTFNRVRVGHDIVELQPGPGMAARDVATDADSDAGSGWRASM